MSDALDIRNSPEALGRFIREARSQLGLSQADITERGGPSSATLWGIEKGNALRLQRGTEDRLSKALGWPTGLLHDLMESPDPGAAIAQLQVTGVSPDLVGRVADGLGVNIMAARLPTNPAPRYVPIEDIEALSYNDLDDAMSALLDTMSASSKEASAVTSDLLAAMRQTHKLRARSNQLAAEQAAMMDDMLRIEARLKELDPERRILMERAARKGPNYGKITRSLQDDEAEGPQIAFAADDGTDDSDEPA